MSVFDKFDLSSFGGSRETTQDLEELSYALAARELASGEVSPGIMAKAYGRAEGDEKKAKALYLELRAAQVEPKIREELKDREADLQQQEQRRAQEKRRREQQERRREAREARQEPESMAIVFLLVFIITVLIVAALVA